MGSDRGKILFEKKNGFILFMVALIIILAMNFGLPRKRLTLIHLQPNLTN